MANTKEMLKEEQEIMSFEKLMRKIAELPEEQRQKVAYYAQGVMAASTHSKANKEQNRSR